MTTVATVATHIDLAKQALYENRTIHCVVRAFLSGIICTALSLFYPGWLPWAPVVLLPLVTYTVYYTSHQPYTYYKQLTAEFRPITKPTQSNITIIWVPNGTGNDIPYYAVHYNNGEVCRVTTEDPLEDD